MALKAHSSCQVSGWEPVPGAVPTSRGAGREEIALMCLGGRGSYRTIVPSGGGYSVWTSFQLQTVSTGIPRPIID